MHKSMARNHLQHNHQRTGLFCIFLILWYKDRTYLWKNSTVEVQYTTSLGWPMTHSMIFQFHRSVWVGFMRSYTFLHFLFFFGLGSHVYSSCVRVSFKNSNDEVRNSHLIFFLSAGCWNNCRVFLSCVRNLLILKFSCLLSLFFFFPRVC